MLEFLFNLDAFVAILLLIVGGIAAVWLFFRDFVGGLLKGDKACWCNVIGFAAIAMLGCTLWGWLQVREGWLVLAAKFGAPVGALALTGLIAWLKPVHHLEDAKLEEEKVGQHEGPPYQIRSDCSGGDRCDGHFRSYRTRA